MNYTEYPITVVVVGISEHAYPEVLEVIDMSFLGTKTTMTIWQVGFFKIPLVTAGILLGTYFHDFWAPVIVWLWIVCVVTSILRL